ncbi:hypothetical protein N1F89_01610 [Aquibium sp. A9E412]|uniref:hypothetical protein n=1 Tax=Aquibium sp. A9E412 TaxID=2976767 RepID=UPI0025AF9D98|nr:hypothetical protein [Aquibium sp. A9E412]MDN2564906.1 hypothetical protein [Aquibium sp. A9E412]
MAKDFPRKPSGEEARLRDDIDSGRTGDKVAAADPAVAPLGTDAEAGGTPTDPQAAAAERRRATGGPTSGGAGETSAGRAGRGAASGRGGPGNGASAGRAVAGALLAVAIAVVVAVALAWA